MDITKSNEQLAKFLGFVNHHEDYWHFTLDKEPSVFQCHGIRTSRMRFHNEWNLLMPIVEQIEKSEYVLAFDVQYDEVFHPHHFVTIIPNHNNTFKYISKSGTTKMEAIYHACVAFAEWHNNHKP